MSPDEKHGNLIFCKFKKAQKTWIEFFASLKISKNINLIFCKLKKSKKNMNLILCKLKKAKK